MVSFLGFLSGFEESSVSLAFWGPHDVWLADANNYGTPSSRSCTCSPFQVVQTLGMLIVNFIMHFSISRWDPWISSSISEHIALVQSLVLLWKGFRGGRWLHHNGLAPGRDLSWCFGHSCCMVWVRSESAESSLFFVLDSNSFGSMV